MTPAEASSPTTVPTTPYRTLAYVALVVGVVLLVASVCAGIGFLAVPLVEKEDAVGLNTAVVSFGAIFLVFGTLLVLIGNGLVRNWLTRPFWLPPPISLMAAFFLVLVIGQGILTLNFATAFLFPVWHVLASLLVPLTVLSYAVHQLTPVSVRSMFAQFAWGGLVTIALAAVSEFVIILIAVGLDAIGIGVVLGTGLLQQILEALRSNPPDTDRVVQLVAHQPLALILAAGTAGALFVLVIPLLEEILKSTGPAILIALRVRTDYLPTRSTALLWGLAAGAGYAFSENMLNAQGGVASTGSVTGLWAGTMILRAGTSLMHVLATATVTVGWYEALVNKRTSRLFLLLIAAAAGHGLWNTGAVLLGGVTVLTDVFGTPSVVGGIMGVGVLTLLALLFVAGLVWFYVLIRWAKGAPETIEPSVQVLHA